MTAEERLRKVIEYLPLVDQAKTALDEITSDREPVASDFYEKKLVKIEGDQGDCTFRFEDGSEIRVVANSRSFSLDVSYPSRSAKTEVKNLLEDI